MGWLIWIGIGIAAIVGLNILLIGGLVILSVARAQQPSHPDIRITKFEECGWGYRILDPYSGSQITDHHFASRKRAYRAAEQHRYEVAERLKEEVGL